MKKCFMKKWNIHAFRKRGWNDSFIFRGIEKHVYVLLRLGASLQVICLLQQHCYWQAREEGSLLISLCFCEYLLFERCHCLHFSDWDCPVALNQSVLILWLILLFCYSVNSKVEILFICSLFFQNGKSRPVAWKYLYCG